MAWHGMLFHRTVPHRTAPYRYHNLEHREKQHTFVASRLGSRPPPAHLGPRGSSRGQVILFTNDPKVTAAHKDLVRDPISLIISRSLLLPVCLSVPVSVCPSLCL